MEGSGKKICLILVLAITSIDCCDCKSFFGPWKSILTYLKLIEIYVMYCNRLSLN